MADSYWARRQRRADEAMSRRERDVHRRVKRYYADEMKRMQQEIAELYERHGGEEGVLRYRDMMRRMDEEDLRLLMRDCEEFARQHPDQAGLVAFRKDAYLLDRLEGLQQSARLHMAKATAEAVEGLDDHFAHVAADAANVVAETMGYGSSFHTYDDDAVRQFVGRPWSDGESFSDRIWDNAAKLAEYVNGDMAKAIARGDSWQKLCREIARRFEGQSASNIMRVVQTEGTYVARQAQGAELQREGFDEYFIDPLGDSRTCEVCRSMGRRSHDEPFRFDEAEVGVNYPPLHPRCRCEVNPAVEDWDEWLHRRREERRQQTGVSDEAVARRFGGKVFGLIDNLKKIQGEHRLTDDLSAVNPNFKTWEPRWQTNCQRCIIAYEMRRRGYDVTAKPNNALYEDKFSNDASPNGWLHVFKNPDPEPCDGSSQLEQRLAVEYLVSGWGDGARAAVVVKFINETGGENSHVFVAENVAGEVKFVDPQSGNPSCENYFDYILPGNTYCMRLDNKEILDTFSQAVEVSKW